MRQIELPQSLVETLEAFLSNLSADRRNDKGYYIEFAKSRPFSRIPIFINWLERLGPTDLEYICQAKDVLLTPVFNESSPNVLLTRHFFLGSTTNVRRLVCERTHKFDWGGLEDPAAELALNILTTLLPPGKMEAYTGELREGLTSKLAYDLTYRFRDRVLSEIPKSATGVFPGTLIKAWIEIHAEQRFWNFPDNKSYEK